MAYWQIHTKRAYYRHHGNSTRSNCSHDTPVAWCSPPNWTRLKSWRPLYLGERRLGRVRPGWRRCPSDQMFTTQGCQTQKATRRTAWDIWLRWSYWKSKEKCSISFSVVQVKTGLAKAILEQDITKATVWVINLHKFIILYGLNFSRADHIYLIKVCCQIRIEYRSS